MSNGGMNIFQIHYMKA